MRTPSTPIPWTEAPPSDARPEIQTGSGRLETAVATAVSALLAAPVAATEPGRPTRIEVFVALCARCRWVRADAWGERWMRPGPPRVVARAAFRAYLVALEVANDLAADQHRRLGRKGARA
jgi:hypothetical protein